MTCIGGGDVTPNRSIGYLVDPSGCPWHRRTRPWRAARDLDEEKNYSGAAETHGPAELR